MIIDDGSKKTVNTIGGILWSMLKIGIFSGLTVLSIRDFLFYHDN